MSEFEEKLNAFLSNPDAMAQVMNLAQSLNLGGEGGAAGGGDPPPGGDPSPAGPPPPEGGGVNLAGLGELLGGIDPQLLQRLLPLAGELAGSGGSDERMQLLYALRPFLKPERRDKVERAARAARLLSVGKKLLAGLGDGHV